MEDAGEDIDTIANADIGFHQTIMSAASNAVIAALFSPIEHLIWEARRQTTSYPRMRSRAIEAHRRILKAIREQDPEAARWAMYDHLIQTEEYLDNFVRSELEEQKSALANKESPATEPGA